MLSAPTAAMASPHIMTESSEDSRSSSTVELKPGRTPATDDATRDPIQSPVVRLGNGSTITVPIRFVPQGTGAQQTGTTFTMIPGDSLHSAVTILNDGGSDATLTGYLTDIQVTTPTTIEDDLWFREMLLKHSFDGSTFTATSLYDVIQGADSERGAPFFTLSMEDDEQVDIDFLLDFPITATAGHEDADRGFSFSLSFVMQDATVMPDGTAPDPDDRTPGAPTPDDNHSDASPDSTSDTDTSDTDTSDRDRLEEDDQNNPDIIAGFPGGNIGLALVLMLGGIALMSGGVYVARKVRGT